MVEVNGRWIGFSCNVQEAAQFEDFFVVVFDYMGFNGNGPSANLVAYRLDGSVLWTAENLTESSSTDAWVGFLDGPGIWAGNFEGYRCRRDTATGRILEKEFTK